MKNITRISAIMLLICFGGIVGASNGQQLEVVTIEEEENVSSVNYLDYLSAEISTALGDYKDAYTNYNRFFRRGGSGVGKKGYLRLLMKDNQFEKIAQEKNVFKDDLEIQIIFLQAYLNTNREKAADVLLSSLLSSHPSNEQVAYFATMLQLKRKQFTQALSTITKLLSNVDEGSRHAIFYFLKSKVLLQLGKQDQALVAVEKSVALYPKFEKGWLFKGLLSEQLGKIENAISGYKRFIDIVGTDAMVERQLINLLFKQERFSEAKQELTKLASNTPEYYFDLALLEWKAGDFALALSNINRALEKKPGFESALLLKVEILVHLKKIDQLLDFMRGWLSKDPSSTVGLHTLLLLRQADVSSAQIINVLASIHKQGHAHKNLLAALADLYLDEMNYRKALPICQEILTKTSDSFVKSKVLCKMGLIYFKTNRMRRVEPVLRQAVEGDRVYPPAYNLLAYYYGVIGQQLEEGIILVDKALKTSPQNPTYLDTKAFLFYKLGNKAKAQALLNQAVRLAPQDKIIREHLKLVR